MRDKPEVKREPVSCFNGSSKALFFIEKMPQ